MEPKKLYRSTTDRVIGGVAAGLAEYFALDPVLVRLLFVIFCLVGGGGLLVYIVMWIVIPEKPGNPVNLHQPHNETQPDMENQEKPFEENKTGNENPVFNETKKPRRREKENKGSLIGGLVLITLGVLFVLDNLLPNINFGDLWPVILIVIGAGLLINAFGFNKKKND
jgi:phage shock protein C